MLTVDVEQLSEQIGLQAPEVFPTIEKCPVCSERQLRMYLDATGRSAGPWCVCNSCEFSGDLIELYAKVQEKAPLERAVNELVQHGCVETSDVDHAIDEIDSYVSSVARTRDIASYWQEARENMQRPGHPDWMRLLRESGLWLGQHGPDWQRELSQFIGGSYIKDAQERLGPLPKGFSVFGITPFYDIQRRISSFALLRPTSRYVIESALKPTIRNADGGLAMLDTIGMVNDDVIAVKDLLFALLFQRNHFVYYCNPVPMVVWNDKTTTSWGNVHANRIILWDYKPSVELFQQCNQLRNAYLPNYNRLWQYDSETKEQCRQRLLRNEGQFRLQLLDTAVPWYLVLKDWIVRHAYDAEVIESVYSLRINDEDMERLLDSCTRKERGVISDVFGIKSRIAHQIQFEEHIIERDGRGWYVCSKSGRVRITNFDLRIHTLVSDENGEAVAQYSITKDDTTLTAAENYDILCRNTKSCLAKLCLKNGLGPVFSHKQWTKSLVDLAMRIHGEPTVVRASRVVGWNQELSAFTFPNFTIDKTGLSAATRFTRTAGLPASNIRISMVTADEARSWLAAGEEYDFALKLQSHILWNLALKRADKPCRPLFIVLDDPKNLGAWKYVQTVLDTFDIPTISVSSMASAQKAYDTAHDYPTAIYNWSDVRHKWMCSYVNGLDPATPQILLLTPAEAVWARWILKSGAVLEVPKRAAYSHWRPQHAEKFLYLLTDTALLDRLAKADYLREATNRVVRVVQRLAGVGRAIQWPETEISEIEATGPRELLLLVARLCAGIDCTNFADVSKSEFVEAIEKRCYYQIDDQEFESWRSID